MVKDIIYLDGVDRSDHTITMSKVTVATKKTIPTFSKFDPEEGQKIYIPSYVNVPKTKFREYIKSKSVRLTTNLDEADIVVIDDDFNYFLKHETTRLYSYMYSTKEFVELLEPLRPDITGMFKDYPHPYFLVHNQVNRYFDDILPDIQTRYSPAKAFDDPERAEKLLSKVIVNSTDLMESMQKDETVIDRDYYKQLDNMLKSSDADNHVVAMEIMANSNYTKSCVYLMILIMDNYIAIDTSRTKRHVNFKSLLNYLNLNPGHLHVDINKIIYFMSERELLTIETLDILRDEVLQDSLYVQHFKAGNGDLLYPIEVALDVEPIRKINNNKPYTFKTTYGRKN
jgi:hypothetical protein